MEVGSNLPQTVRLEKQRDPNRKGLCAGGHPNSKRSVHGGRGITHTKESTRENSQWATLESPRGPVFHCGVADSHKFSGLKHLVISSQFCKLEVQQGMVRFSPQGLMRLCCHVELGILFHIHPCSGQNSVPYSCRTGVPMSYSMAHSSDNRTAHFIKASRMASKLLVLLISFKDSPD